MKLLRRRAKGFEIQVQELTLHISAPEEYAEESRAAALGFWEQLQSYALRNPEFRRSKRPLGAVDADAPPVVKEVAASATKAGVGPMYAFRGALVDEVGRFLAGSFGELTVSCSGEYFIKAKKRMKLGVRRAGGPPLTVALTPEPGGLGVSTAVGRAHGAGPDGLAVIAETCKLADAAAAGVHALLARDDDGLGDALRYLKRVPGVRGGVIIDGDRVGMAGAVEIAG